MPHGQSTRNLLTGKSSVSTSRSGAKVALRLIRMISLSCCNVEVNHAKRLSSLLFNSFSCLQSCAVQQLRVLAEDLVRRAPGDGEEVEHPQTLAFGNHVETVVRDGPRRGEARDTGML